MKNKKTKKNQTNKKPISSGKKDNRHTETITESIYGYANMFLQLGITAYLLLIIVALPLYNEEGYAHIGTDKAMFFRKIGVNCAKIVIPLAVLAFLLKVVLYCREQGRNFTWKRLLTDVAVYFQTKWSVTDWCVFTYGISVILSYLATEYKRTALWGTQGWYMGLIPQMILVVSYFLIAKVWNRNKWLIATVIPVSLAVFILGYINRFDIDPLNMQISNPHFISTIGNINWYCGYLVSVFFVMLGFFLWNRCENLWMKVLLFVYVAVGFGTLVTHGSSSGIVSMAATLLLLLVLSAKEAERMERFCQSMIVFSLVCLITMVLRTKEILNITYVETTTELFTNSKLPILMTIVSFLVYIVLFLWKKNNRYPARVATLCARGVGILAILGIITVIGAITYNTLSAGILEQRLGLPENSFLTFTDTWGSNRGATWKAGILCFLEAPLLQKLIGVGPDCMSDFLYGAGSEELLTIVQNCFGTLRLTNAHNEWLTVCVNMGLLGFIGYVGMMVSAIWRFLRRRQTHIISAACGLGLFAYTVNGMFSFQQSMGISTIFLILAVGENFMGQEAE